jgi:hypothetical protein
VCDEELPFMPVTQRLALLQTAMFDLLPELIQLLDNVFQTPSNESKQTQRHSLIIEEHMRSMRTHFKSSGLGLMWLGVVRTHCTAPSAQAVALNEMASRVVKLHVRLLPLTRPTFIRIDSVNRYDASCGRPRCFGTRKATELTWRRLLKRIAF